MKHMANQTNRRRVNVHFPTFDIELPEARRAGEALSPFKALVKRLSEAYGPSGSEDEVRELVRVEIKPYADQVRMDALGNLIVQRRGNGAHRKKIMLAAHLDEIGVIVTHIDGRGFCRFGPLGPSPRLLPGERCRFANGTLGVFGREEEDASRNENRLEKMFIDVGATGAENAPVKVGDAAALVREFVDNGRYWIGKALDDRLGCAIVIETLRRLQKTPYDIDCVFTVQQEVGGRGASVAAYALQPDMAFVVDATLAADTPGAIPGAIALGKGPAIKVKDAGLVTSSTARQALLRAAREARVPVQLEVTSRVETDGTTIQAAREGVPTGVLSIPLRYARTASEMVAEDDVQHAIQLLLALLSKPL